MGVLPDPDRSGEVTEANHNIGLGVGRLPKNGSGAEPTTASRRQSRVAGMLASP